MQILNQDDKFRPIEQPKISGPVPRNERDSIVNEITARLQAEYKPFYIKAGKKIRVQPITLKWVCVRLAPFKQLSDLYHIHSVCKQSTSYTAMFRTLTKFAKK